MRRVSGVSNTSDRAPIICFKQFQADSGAQTVVAPSCGNYRLQAVTFHTGRYTPVQPERWSSNL